MTVHSHRVLILLSFISRDGEGFGCCALEFEDDFTTETVSALELRKSTPKKTIL